MKDKPTPPPLYVTVPNDFKLGDKLYLEDMDFVTIQGVRFRASTRDLKDLSPTKLERVEGIVYQVVRTFRSSSK